MKHPLMSVLIGVLLSAFTYATELVTPETYILAEIDLYFKKIANNTGLNVFIHNQAPAFIKQQTDSDQNIVYSFGLFFAPKGTTITLPKSKDGRYQSAMIMQNDHYIPQVFYGQGTYEIESYTDFVVIIIRTQVDSIKEEDMKYTDTLQQQVVITHPKGTRFKEFEPQQWDLESFEVMRAQFKYEGKLQPHLNVKPSVPRLLNSPLA
jgi:hypothetical protein